MKMMRATVLALGVAGAAAFSSHGWAPTGRRAPLARVSMGPYKTLGEEVIEVDARKHMTKDLTMSRVTVVRTIDRASKESFAADVYGNAELEEFLKAAGQSMYPKLMKRARAKVPSRASRADVLVTLTAPCIDLACTY
jgi:hypothetical protein